MKSQTNKQSGGAIEELPSNRQLENYWTTGAWLMQIQLQIYVRIGFSTSSVKHHSETHIKKKKKKKHCDKPKQRPQWWSEARTQENQKDRTTISPTTDIDNQAPTLWNRLRRKPSFSLRTDPPSCIKEGSKAINHNWVNNHACSLPQNIHVLTYLFVSALPTLCLKL